MTFLPKKKNSLRLSIPIKVIVLTFVVYFILWGIGVVLDISNAVVSPIKIFGIEFHNIYTAVEILIVSMTATLGTHFFLDRPLAKLTDAMSKAEKGDFLIRAPIVSKDELGELAQRFNGMLTRITDLTANKIQADHDLMLANEQLKFRKSLEEKNTIIERTNRTLEQLVRNFSLIYEIGQEVNSIVDLDKLYAHIADTLKKYLKVQEFALLVFDEKGEELHVKIAHGFPDPDAILRTTFSKGEGITGQVAETGKKIYVKDTSRDHRFLNYKGERPPHTSSFLSVPLSYKSEVLGVINFARRGINTFTYQDVKMLSQVAVQIALALANSRLYTRTRELSVMDELTGINNRRHFQQMLQMEWKRAVRFKRDLSIIMVDVDYFKSYNDTFGHLRGDEVLRKIGQLLKRNLREVDTVARFGGEEFVLLLPDTDKRGAIAVAEKVRLMIADHKFIADEHGDARTITISLGVSSYPGDVIEMDDLIDRADIALYRAKEKGRNRTECYSAPGADREDELERPIPSLADQELARLEKRRPKTLQ